MKVLFDIQYINYAWGYVNKGYLIMEDGDVYRYRLIDSEDPKNGLLNYKHQNSDLAAKIDIRPLYAMLVDSKDGEISERKHVAFDAGGTTYLGYLGDQEIFIAETGVTEQFNLAARELYHTLKMLKDRLDQKYAGTTPRGFLVD